jgi:O-methyltransferase
LRGKADRKAQDPEPVESPANEESGVQLGSATKKGGDLRRQLAELRSSYYLSGAKKKLDLRNIPGFSELARSVIAEGRTGTTYDRLHVLWQAARQAPDGLPVAEVGVYLGGSAKFICETLRQTGRSPRTYVCDTFSGHAKVDPNLEVAQTQVGLFADTSADDVGEYLRDYPNVEIVEGDFTETSARLAQESFGFAHVDVDVYAATAFCLEFFAPRLAPGALLVVDDYGFVTCPGAKKAVDEFIAARPDFRLLHLLTAQAVLFRGGVNVREPPRTWLRRPPRK